MHMHAITISRVYTALYECAYQFQIVAYYTNAHVKTTYWQIAHINQYSTLHTMESYGTHSVIHDFNYNLQNIQMPFCIYV